VCVCVKCREITLKTRSRREGNNGLKLIQYGRIHLAQEWDQWRAAVKMVINLRAP
jgi:hypothetical protein